MVIHILVVTRDSHYSVLSDDEQTAAKRYLLKMLMVTRTLYLLEEDVSWRLDMIWFARER